MGRAASFIDIATRHAQAQPQKKAFIFLADGVEESGAATFSVIDQRARAIAALLQQRSRAGERVLLLYPSGMDYIEAFLGCLYAGRIAVPAYPPSARPKDKDDRILGILQDARPSLVMTASDLLERSEEFLSIYATSVARGVIATDTIESKAALAWRRPHLNRGSIAFLQYTSGSTRLPHGVMITHGNLLENERVIARAFEHDEASIIGGWLPFFHDMGLIGNILQPLFLGATCILMPSQVFFQKPIKWLSMISRYRVTTSGGPNFAYDICVRHVDVAERQNLDLSSWRIAFNGAEPINPKTLERFTRVYGPSGFRPEAFYPCYGLAEATLMVAGSKALTKTSIKSFQGDGVKNVPVELSSSTGVRSLAGYWLDVPKHKILVVDPESRSLCPDGVSGEVWVSGPSVAQGYWRRKRETRGVFGARIAGGGRREFLRTGDLGFVSKGELFISGRIKDLIIVRGKNHYPQDIELAVEESHPALGKHSGAAFAVEVSGEERLVIVQEIERQYRKGPFEGIVGPIRRAVAEGHQLEPYAVVLIRPFTIPRTSSGKIRRGACREKFLAGTLEVLFQSLAAGDIAPGQAATAPPIDWAKAGAEEKRSVLAAFIRKQVSASSQLDAEALDGEKPLGLSGLDSLRAMEIAWAIEREFKLRLPIAKMLATPDLNALVELLLAGDQRNGGLSCGPKISAEAALAGHGPMPLSREQERLWFLHQADPESSLAYQIVLAVRIHGPLRVDALESSLNRMLERHVTLRTTFTAIDGLPLQTIREDVRMALPVEDLRALPAEVREATARRIARVDAQRPFNPERGPLLASKLFRMEEAEHILVLGLHHICCDGWSLKVLLLELARWYEAFTSGKPADVPQAPWSYLDYAAWQRGRMGQADLDQQVQYWKGKLKGPCPVLNLGDRNGGKPGSFASAQHSFEICRKLRDQLRKLGQREEATPFMTLLAGFKWLLFERTRQKDILVGTSTANRVQPETEWLVGPFTNALMLRTEVGEGWSFLELLREVRHVALEAYANQDVPFDRVVRELGLNRGPGKGLPFKVVFLYHNYLPTRFSAANLDFELLDFESGVSNFELTLSIFEGVENWKGLLTYKRELFSAEQAGEITQQYLSLLEKAAEQPSGKLWSNGPRPKEKLTPEPAAPGALQIAIASTFTAGLVEESLGFWMRELGINYQIAFAPYDNVFQQLLDTHSLFSDPAGMNVVMLRVSDLDRRASHAPPVDGVLRKNIQELGGAVGAYRARTAKPLLVVCCPSDVSSAPGAKAEEMFRQMEGELATELSRVRGVCVLGSAELLRWYPVADLHDPNADLLGNIPFTPQFFTGVGTAVARWIHAMLGKSYKVIVLDGDDTLWKGRCGEEGPLGIEVDPPRRSLQQFMVAQHEAGMLVCVCSKNNETDVLQVFDAHPEMPLERRHVLAWKINWEPKSANLRALGRELGLGLSSFVFIDDNPIECAEVKANCPEVLTLELPQVPDKIPRMLEHVWAFDRWQVTGEDRQRTTLYRQNFERERYRQEFMSYAEFLCNLELVVQIRTITAEDIARASQLMRRTNQFNFTGTVCRERELDRLVLGGEDEGLVVQAKDRFGDYGLVGVVILGRTEEAICVRNFLLSCRALGRGIEHRIAARLGEMALQAGRRELRMTFVPTGKNKPAWQFLNEIASPSPAGPDPHACDFMITAEVAAGITPQLASAEAGPTRAEPGSPAPPKLGGEAQRGEILARIAREFSDPRVIHKAIAETKQHRDSKGPLVPPRTPTEDMLQAIWVEVLNRADIGVEEDFFVLGGQSLLGAVMLARVRKEFEVELPFHLLFEKPTIAGLAEAIEGELIRGLDNDEIAAALHLEPQMPRVTEEASGPAMVEMLSESVGGAGGNRT